MCSSAVFAHIWVCFFADWGMKIVFLELPVEKDTKMVIHDRGGVVERNPNAERYIQTYGQKRVGPSEPVRRPSKEWREHNGWTVLVQKEKRDMAQSLQHPVRTHVLSTNPLQSGTQKWVWKDGKRVFVGNAPK